MDDWRVFAGARAGAGAAAVGRRGAAPPRERGMIARLRLRLVREEVWFMWCVWRGIAAVGSGDTSKSFGDLVH